MINELLNDEKDNNYNRMDAINRLLKINKLKNKY
jgi:hypothetical protein